MDQRPDEYTSAYAGCGAQGLLGFSLVIGYCLLIAYDTRLLCLWLPIRCCQPGIVQRLGAPNASVAASARVARRLASAPGVYGPNFSALQNDWNIAGRAAYAG